jgi:hypothetical protein
MKNRKPTTDRRHRLWSRTDSYVLVAVIVAVLLLLGSSVRANAILKMMDDKGFTREQFNKLSDDYINDTLRIYKTEFIFSFTYSFERERLIQLETEKYRNAAFDPTCHRCPNLRRGGLEWADTLNYGYQSMRGDFDIYYEGDSSELDYPPINVYAEKINHLVTYGYGRPRLDEYEPWVIEKGDWIEGDAWALYLFYKWLDESTPESIIAADNLANPPADSLADLPADDAPQPHRVYLRLLKEVLTIPAGKTGNEAYIPAAEVVPKVDGTPRTGGNVRRRYSDWRSKPHNFNADEIALIVSELEEERRHVNRDYLSAIYRNVKPI